MNKMEKFCLKWNEFESNIRESFRELRKEQTHFDVTLATDDGHQIEAHKIILSARSQFFSGIFRKTKHASPFIYLKGIKRIDLEYVIDFLYNGEAYVAQEELNKFLETAQELQVKGLQSNHGDESGKNQRVEEKLEIETKYSINQNESILDSMEELSVTFANGDFDLVQTEENNLWLNTNIELDLQIEQMMEKIEGLWHCKVCGKTVTSKNKTHLKDHMESQHIEGVSHICHLCNKIWSTRKALRDHVRDHHSDLTFDCNVCGEIGMAKMAFKNHKRTCKFSQ